MSVKNSALVLQKLYFSPTQPTNLNTPHYHILILAWCALVVIYGETDSSPPFHEK
jgi:hypothetical protein